MQKRNDISVAVAIRHNFDIVYVLVYEHNSSTHFSDFEQRPFKQKFTKIFHTENKTNGNVKKRNAYMQACYEETQLCGMTQKRLKKTGMVMSIPYC